MPFIVRGPGVPADSVDYTPIIGMDLYSTFAALAGLAERVPAKSEGTNVLPWWQAQAGDNQPLSQLQRLFPGLGFHFPHYLRRAGGPSSAYIQFPWKIVYHYETKRPELFHLGNDPLEQNDLATTDEARTAMMQTLLDAWLQAVAAKLPVDNAAYYPDQPKPSLNKKGKKRK